MDSKQTAPTDKTVINLVGSYITGITGKRLSDELVEMGYVALDAQRVVQRNLDRGSIILGPGLKIFIRKTDPLKDIIDILEAVTVEDGLSVFEHSAEEIGIAVMNNCAEILIALKDRWFFMKPMRS